MVHDLFAAETGRKVVAHGEVWRSLAPLPKWLSADGELAGAFYTAAFDLGIDELKQVLGIDEAYRQRYQRSTVALEAHLRILAPVRADDVMAIGTRIVDCDAKRLHAVQTLLVQTRLVATRESMTISFDLAARRSCPFDPEVLARMVELHRAQRQLALVPGVACAMDPHTVDRRS